MNLPKHTKKCIYTISGENLWTLCDCRAKFNGKPFAHWQKLAQREVIDHILRAPCMFNEGDTQSIIDKLTRDRLRYLINEESPELVQELIEERERCSGTMSAFMAAMVGK